MKMVHRRWGLLHSSLLFFAFQGFGIGETTFQSRDRADVQISHLSSPEPFQKFLSKYGWTQPVEWVIPPLRDVLAPGDRDPASGDVTDFIREGVSSSVKHNPGIEPHSHASDYTQALKLFQKTNALPVTGVLDGPTKEAMNKPRCGVPDRIIHALDPASKIMSTHTFNIFNHTNRVHGTGQNQPSSTPIRRKRFLQTLFKRFKRARGTELASGSVFGMALAKSQLKWILMQEGYSSHLTEAEQKATLRLAFRLWSEVAPIDFEEDTQESLLEADIKLGFGTGRHFGCSQVFDGAGQELAHAWQHGEIHFDDDEHFTPSNAEQGISLLKVAVHEIGHVLGLPHIYRTGSVMHPSYSTAGDRVELDIHDRRAIQHLYGICEGPFDTVFDWIREEHNQRGEQVVHFNTYFFRKGWYWMYENRKNRTRYGDPQAISVGWPGLSPEGIDAFLHVWTRSRDNTYFFKGTQYWSYDSENNRVLSEDAQGCRYPKRIAQGFPGVQGPIDAAFFDRRDQCIYFFQDHMVTAFNANSNQRASGYPKMIMDVFPAVVPGDHPVGHLDAVYFSYSHQATFFFKGIYFWKVVDVRDRLGNHSLPCNGLLPKRKVVDQWRDICDVHPSVLAMD